MPFLNCFVFHFGMQFEKVFAVFSCGGSNTAFGNRCCDVLFDAATFGSLNVLQVRSTHLFEVQNGFGLREWQGSHGHQTSERNDARPSSMVEWSSEMRLGTCKWHPHAGLLLRCQHISVRWGCVQHRNGRLSWITHGSLICGADPRFYLPFGGKLWDSVGWQGWTWTAKMVREPQVSRLQFIDHTHMRMQHVW